MTEYHQIDELRIYYLEDSWVLDVVARPGILVITMDVVLLPEHQDYEPPPPGKNYCYRRAELRFEGVTSLRWTGQGLPPARDASGEIDYGGIDSLLFEDHHYRVSGNFGDIVVHAKLIQVHLFPPTRP